MEQMEHKKERRMEGGLCENSISQNMAANRIPTNDITGYVAASGRI
jgi:hypothetical protein